MNQEQYQFIQEKYGNLIHMIAQKINGDVARCDPDDNVQDLWISALEAIRGYELRTMVRMVNLKTSKIPEALISTSRPACGTRKVRRDQM